MKPFVAPTTLRTAFPATPVRRVSWLGRALPIMVFLVLLNLAANVAQTLTDFSSLNERTARHLDTLASAVTLSVQDRVEAVDHTFLMVGDAIATGTLSDETLGRIVAQDREALGHAWIAVLDSSDRMLASSPQVSQSDKVWTKALRSTNITPSSFAQPVRHDSISGLLFVRAHRGEAGQADVRIAIVVPADRVLGTGVEFPQGSSALLLSHDDRVIVRYPSIAADETGSVYHGDGLKREGPIPSTYYAISGHDGREWLKTFRTTSVGDSGDSWKLEIAYAVGDYRSAWLHSLFLNLLGMGTEITLLVAGIVLLRRETRLQKEIGTWSGFVSTVVRNTSTPIALVDIESGKITQANDALRGIFGVRAQAGNRISTLFADPGSWTDTGVRDSSEPVAMLASTGTVQMIVRCIHVPGHANDANDKERLLVSVLDVSQQYAQISQLRNEADLDPLTKLPNRRSFTRASRSAVAQAQKLAGPLAVLSLDLDHFKRVNDTWGHAAGDRVLEVVAGRINESLRDQDLPARVGGEEFAVLLQGTRFEQAHDIAERVRLAVAATPVTINDGQALCVTVSIGIAMYRTGEPDLSAALARADAALYRAKHAGRNRVDPDGEEGARDPRSLEVQS